MCFAFLYTANTIKGADECVYFSFSGWAQVPRTLSWRFTALELTVPSPHIWIFNAGKHYKSWNQRLFWTFFCLIKALNDSLGVSTQRDTLFLSKEYCFWPNKENFLPSLRTAVIAVAAAAVGSRADCFGENLLRLWKTIPDFGVLLTDSLNCLSRTNCSPYRCALPLGAHYLLPPSLKSEI